MSTLAVNKQAKLDYEILEKYTAGIVLLGPEVKSVRAGQINMKGSFANFSKDILYLNNVNISKYKHAKGITHYDPTRPRPLLLKKKEIKKIKGKLQQKSLTLIPLKVYTKGKWIKVDIAICKGKKKYDKRETLKKRDVDKQIRQRIKNNF